MVTHENGGGHGHHQPPSGFIRKWIFSIDHKVIGIQYLLLALFSVFVGMALSLLMRLHLAWPTAKFAVLQGRPDDAGAVSGTDDHARHDHGLHGADHGAAVRLRQLFPAHSNRRGGHGVSRAEHAFVLDNVSYRSCVMICAFFVSGGAPIGGWTSYPPLSALGEIVGPGQGARRNALDCRPGDFLRRVADGRAQFHHHADRSSREGHDARPACR